MQTGNAVNGTMIVDLPDAVCETSQMAEVICGYALQERIGAGAFGEVWRAVSPGGLPKALKILHGSYDGATAETELKSLQLMRELRHPFLLSVERIETSGGRLVIVTELADQNLEERFVQLTNDGHRGIPRDELLKFLHDAADALDFMHEQHNLQHLDIKPSNLLLQGGHVKVADFGLIKNLNESDLSMISGFTPAYAPPELFHGRPGRNSDQYSLAIVFQVMLTGVPPFAGRTIAQLTAQHLSSKPDLSALSPGDQAIVARALSKNANARFPTCREFVDRLSQRSTTSSRMGVHKPVASPKPSAAEPAAVPLSPGTDVLSPKVEAVPLPAVEVDDADLSYRPTLFLGVGGLAGKVLVSLRGRMSSLCGERERLAAFPFLYIDTDAQAVDSIHAQTDRPVLNADETLAIPLRERSHYRSLSGGLLEWLSRRWLYNIPRSGQVEGLRPLGRLAFVDHQREIRDYLRRALTHATSDDAVQETARTLGAPVGNERLDVYLIASTCGGTGSGAVLDVSYLLRSVCEELKIELGDVHGLLLHATAHRDQSAELRSANTLSCLKELACFSSAERGYPGDRACSLPGGSQPPFDYTHLVHLGESLTDQELAAQTDRVVEYLFRNTATPARAFFAKCQVDDASTTHASAMTTHVRTFGTLILDDVAGGVDRARALAVCRAFVKRCSQRLQVKNQSTAPSAGAQHAAALTRDLHVDGDSLLQSAAAVFQGELGHKVSRYVLQKLERERDGNDSRSTRSQIQRIDADFAAEVSDQTPGGHPARILAAFQQHLTQATENVSARLSTAILSCSTDPERGWSFACELLVAVVAQLEKSKAGMSERAAAIANEMQQLHAGLNGAAGAASNPPGGAQSAGAESECTPLVQHAMLCFCGLVFDCLYDHVRQVCGVLQERARVLRGELGSLDDSLRQTQLADAATEPGRPAPEVQEASPLAPSVVASFERSVCLSPGIQFADLMQQSVPREATARLLMRAALKPLLQRDSDAESPPGTGLPTSAAPLLAHVGGGRRVLAVLPGSGSADDWKRQLEDEFGECVTLQQGERAEHFVCCEVQGIDLERVIGSFAGKGERICDIASRVHTRIDVEWNDFA